MIHAYDFSLDAKATAARIVALRKTRGLSVKQVADFMGFEYPQAVYKWERGESLPTLDNFYALSRLLGVTVDELLVGSGEDAPVHNHLLAA